MSFKYASKVVLFARPHNLAASASGAAVRIQEEGDAAAAAAADGTSSPLPSFLSRSKNFEEEKSEAAFKSTPDAREIRGRTTDVQQGVSEGDRR